MKKGSKVKRTTTRIISIFLVFILMYSFVGFNAFNAYAESDDPPTEETVSSNENSSELEDEVLEITKEDTSQAEAEAESDSSDESLEETPEENPEPAPTEEIQIVDKSAELEEVPSYYVEADVTGGPVSKIYKYKTKNAEGEVVELFRIYASIDGANAAFYASDELGNPLEPVTPLNQTDENNNAYNEGGQASEIRPLLEPDQAVITSLSIQSTVTGTPGWDSDDAPGNDSSGSNDIVRSFDQVSYTPKFNLRLQNEAEEKSIYYVAGDMYLRFTLPNAELKEVNFDLESMPWLVNPVQTQVGSDVVLTASYRHTGSQASPAIPGEGTLPSVVVQVRGAMHGKVVQPTFTAWLEGNDESEQKSVTSKEVTVSAAPRYNVQLRRNGTLNKLDHFDFTTGNDLALNKDQETVYGRLYGYGVAVQLYNTNTSKGLKGIELPSGEISFDINLKTTFIPAGGQEKDITEQYQPLVWDYIQHKTSDANVTDLGVFERQIRYMHNSNYGVFIIPNNAYTSPNATLGIRERSAYNGGDWNISQDGAKISINFDDYEFHPDYLFPIRNQGDSETVSPYGANVGNFSTGYIEILQPLPETTEEKEALGGNGEVYATLSNGNLQATSLSGVSLPVVADNSNQMFLRDDTVRYNVPVRLPGTYSKNIFLSRRDSASYPGFGTGAGLASHYTLGDNWTVPGKNIWISDRFFASGDSIDEVNSFNILSKFDAEAIEVEDLSNPAMSATSPKSGVVVMPELTYVYATKPDGSNWFSDAEMNSAREEDLVFYVNKSDVPSGHQIVAVLLEGRNGHLETARQSTWAYAAKVKDTAEVGKVYQFINDVRIWTMGQVEEEGPIPARSKNAGVMPEDVTKPIATLDMHVRPDLYTYTKSYYNESGWAGGHKGGTNAGNSLLIVGVETRIKKTTPMTTSTTDSTPKKMFRMAANERTVWYRLDPIVQIPGKPNDSAVNTTSVTIKDVLPFGVTPTGNYYYGGSFNPDPNDPNGGTFDDTGAELLIPEVTRRDVTKTDPDGGTHPGFEHDVTFQFEDILPGPGAMQPIYIETIIGDVGSEDDVWNMYQPLNRATIYSPDDGRAQLLVNGNVAEYSIQIIKAAASGLNKSVLQSLVEIHEKIEFELVYSNISSEEILKYRMLDSLPYNGDDRGTKYDGDYTFDLTLTSGSEDTNSHFELQASARTFTKDQDINTVDQMTDHGFMKLDPTSETGKVAIFEGLSHDEVKSIRLEGNLAPQDKVSLRITMYPTTNKSGNIYVNDASGAQTTGDYNYAPQVSTVVVGREVSGLVWYDYNMDGRRQSDETLIPHVKVRLVDETGNPVKDILGNDIAPVYTDANGSYEFKQLAPGAVRVVFEHHEDASKFNYSMYDGVSPLHVDGVPYNVNSDAVVNNPDDFTQGAYIDLVLPEKENTPRAGFRAPYLDMGLYQTGELKLSKEIKGIIQPETDFDFTVSILDNLGNKAKQSFAYTGSFEGTIKDGDTIKLKGGEWITITGLIPGYQYNVVELQDNVEPYTTTKTGDAGSIIRGTQTAAFVNEVKPTTNIELLKEADQDELILGETILYTFSVTNTGNTILKDVTVTDPMFPDGITLEKTTLLPGETTVSVGEYPRAVTQEDMDRGYIENTALTKGHPVWIKAGEEPEELPPGYELEDPTDESTVIVEGQQFTGIELEKVADLKTYQVGDVITYTFTVTNTGNVTLTDVTVTDPMFPEGITLEQTVLAPGESTTGTAQYTVTQEDVDQGHVYNKAETTGTPPGDIEPPKDEDDEDIPGIQEPGITLEKVADLKTYKLGDLITYTFTVTNTGNVTLTDVTVTDPMFPEGITLEQTVLAPGESTTGMAEYTVTQEDIDQGHVYNKAETTGTPPGDNEPPKDEDDEDIPGIQEPGIELKKVADKKVYKLGDVITYTFTVTNTGNVTLTDVTVTDPMITGEITLEKTVLSPGESTLGTAKYRVSSADEKAEKVYNKATAIGIPPGDNEPPKDDDDVTVKVEKTMLPITGAGPEITGILGGLLTLGGVLLFRRKKRNS